MKRIIFSLLTSSSLLAMATFSHAEVQQLSGGTKVQFNEVPAPVQQAVRAQAGAAEIEDIDRGTLNGRTVYEVAFKKNGQHTELRVGEDGSVIDTIVAGQSTGATAAVTPPAPVAVQPQIQEQAGAASKEGQGDVSFDEGFAHQLSGAKKISWDEVPAHVQKIMKEKAGSAKIEDVDKGKLGKHVAYQAAYKKNGQHTELRVKENGQFREVQGLKVISASSEHMQGFGRSLSGQKEISWREVPQNVRQIVKQRLGDTKVEHAYKGTLNDTTTYQFSYDKNGKNGELRVTEDGVFVKDVVAGKVVYESSGAKNK